MFLLDTNVVSELRKSKPHGAVLAWLNTVGNSELSLSAVTLGEIQAGVEKTREQDPGKAAEIETWLQEVEETHRVLPMDGKTFRRWAKLMHHKSDTLYEDAMITATAMEHGLTVVTRNVSDFVELGVQPFDPFSWKPNE